MNDRHARRRRRVDPRRRPADGFRVAGLGRFTRIVEQALAELPQDVADRVARLELTIHDVPPTDDDAVPLARLVRDLRGRTVAMELYRRPIEARSTSAADLRLLIADVIEDELADG